MEIVYNCCVEYMKKLIAITITLLFSFLVIPIKNVSAKVIVEEEGLVSVAKDEVVNDDLFVGAQTVEILGTVNGDVYVGAESLRVDGVINGNLHAGAGMATISGEVNGSVYIGTGNLIVENAKIGNSLLIGAGNVNIDSDSEIGGSLLVGSGSVFVNSPVGRNIFMGAGQADLNSNVGGEVRVAGGVINLGPNAKIAKDLTYSVDEDEGSLNISDSASVAGQVKKGKQRFATEKELDVARQGFSQAFRAFNFISKLISFAGALIVGLLAMKFFEKPFSTAALNVEKSFWKSLGVGFLVIIAAVPAFILLAVTGVGLSLAWVLLLLLLLGVYFSKITVALCFGNWIKDKLGNKNMSVYLAFALGLFGLYILKLIPIVGFLTSATILFSGLGALTLHLKSNVK